MCNDIDNIFLPILTNIFSGRRRDDHPGPDHGLAQHHADGGRRLHRHGGHHRGARGPRHLQLQQQARYKENYTIYFSHKYAWRMSLLGPSPMLKAPILDASAFAVRNLIMLNRHLNSRRDFGTLIRKT